MGSAVSVAGGPDASSSGLLGEKLTGMALTKQGEANATAQEIIKDKAKLHELWNRLDFNGNGIVSLAEIDKVSGLEPSGS